MSAPEEDGSRIGADEWNRCVRRGCWSIALGTIMGAVASVFVFSDAPVIFGTSLGVGWALRNCRSQMREVEVPPITMESKEDHEIPEPHNLSECTCGDDAPDPGGLMKPGRSQPPPSQYFEDTDDVELIQETTIPDEHTYDEEYAWDEGIQQGAEEEPTFDQPYEVEGFGIGISDSETSLQTMLKRSESLESLVPVDNVNTGTDESNLPCTCQAQYFFNSPQGEEPQTEVAEQIIKRIQEFASGPEITLALLKELAKNQSPASDKKTSDETVQKKK